MDRNFQLEHLHSKYTGTGNADMTKHVWMVHQHRDTYASMLGRPNLMTYLSIMENTSMERARANLFKKMIQPCGPAPAKMD